jgi:sulfopyruvate decarboxylase subunit beta
MTPQLTEVLDALAEQRTDQAVIATMSAGIHWPIRSRSDRDLAYYAPMGSAAAVGVGLAATRPDIDVIVLDGDGSLLMNLGVLVTIGSLKPRNLLHAVMVNHKYDVTGGQPIPGIDTARLDDLAAAAGVPNTKRVASVAGWQEILAEWIAAPACTFVAVEVESNYDRAEIPGLITDPAATARHSFAGYAALKAAIAR